MDLLEDLLDGTPPWAYNDNVDMGQDEEESSMSVVLPEEPVSSFPSGSPKEPAIAFPPHWAELMEQIRVREEEMKRVMLSRRSGESVSFESKVPSMLPVSSYSLLPPPTIGGGGGGGGSSEAAFQPPHAAFPHMPFWSAAPLPFSPNVYPVNVLPPTALKSVLAPKAPPRPAAGDKKKRVGRVKSKGRQRDAKGLFIKSPPQEPGAAVQASGSGATTGAEMDNLSLMGRIQELQKQLLESRYESVVLREQLVHSQMELSQLKDRGLVRANLRGYADGPASGAGAGAGATPIPPPSFSVKEGRDSWKSSSPPPPAAAAAQAMDAFRVQLDYAQIKSKLRPTNHGHFDAESPAPLATEEQQQQQQQQQQSSAYQWDMSE